MRRASGLRVSSTRNVCVFCATRPVPAADASIRLSTVSQQRHLQSSGKVPHYDSQQQVYKEETAPPRSMTMAERARQQLMAGVQSAVHPSPAQGGYMSPAEKARLALQSSAPARPPPPQRHQHAASQRPAPIRRNVLNGPGRDRAVPTRQPQNGFMDNRQGRHTVNMNSRPHIESPTFGVGHLRRRNEEAQANHRQQELRPARAARPAPSRKLDNYELSRLLQDNSKRQEPTRQEPAQQYTRLTTETNKRLTCWHCGQTSHLSIDCPDKPTLKWSPGQKSFQEPESLSDAAEAWVQRKGATIRAGQTNSQFSNEKEEKNRAVERRNRRFGNEPVEIRNRYEEPERRRGGGERRSRRIVRGEVDEDDAVVDRVERKRQRKEAKKAAMMAKEEPTPIYLPEYISVANLASMLKLRADDFVMKLEELGFEDVKNDHILNAEHAALVAQEYNFEPIIQTEEHENDLYPAPALSPEEYAKLPIRPPVVTIMGHVDHGKTTILDYIRSTAVAATEFGGITQHIGAFSVPLASGKNITFLDTPGHSAFETMRARGANVTDIVVLVVAADDSVMPQTVEAIKHAQAAQVPIIVAINKIDKSQADPDAVKADLGRHGVTVEDFGGDVQTICVSGKTGQGIPDLEEAITTLSEILDHRADPQASVEGWVLEGATKKSGRVATVLVRSGTLRQGDIIVAGNTWARVRTLRNEAGVAVEEIGPGMPVEVDGWREQPIAGDEVLQAADEQQATYVTELRLEKVERKQLAKDMEAINEFRRQESDRREAEDAAEKAVENGESVVVEEVKEKGPETVTFIIKGDVSGSVEAVIDSVSAIGNAEVSTRILRHGVGSPSEFDVQHAADAKGHIINFNTVIPPHINAMAEEKGVKIMDSNIIYRIVENVKGLLSEKLPPKIIQKVTGEAEVAQVFEIGLGGRKKMKVAGSKVRNGVVDRGTKARVLRGEKVIFDGILNSLKNVKKDVEQMRKDTECGIGFEGWDDFLSGDKIQCYEETYEKRYL